MTLKEIVTGIKSGEVKVNLMGHVLPQPIINILEDRLKYNQSMMDAHDYTAEVLALTYKKNYVDGDYIEDSDSVCLHCKERNMRLVFFEGEVVLMSGNLYWLVCEELAEKHGGVKYSYSPLKSDIHPCKAVGIIEAGKLTANIELPSGVISFRNYFDPEELYEMPSTKDNFEDLNSIEGRQELMTYLSKKGVGYGQMGNMSVGIFKKNDLTEILVARRTDYDWDTDTETTRNYPGFTYHGSISLSVWRWMCADRSVLKKHGVECVEKVDALDDTRIFFDEILMKVEPGTWEIEHYYDIRGDAKEGIYSRLKLTK